MREPQHITGAGHNPPPHYLADEELPFGKLIYGTTDYNEFVCSKSTAAWLQAGGMTHVDGRPVKVLVKDQFHGGRNVVAGFFYTGAAT